MKNQFNRSLPSHYDTAIYEQSSTVKREIRVSLAFIIWAADTLRSHIHWRWSPSAEDSFGRDFPPGLPVASSPLSEKLLSKKYYILWIHELGYVTYRISSSYCYKILEGMKYFYEKANSMIETIFMSNILKYSGELRLRNSLLAHFK